MHSAITGEVEKSIGGHTDLLRSEDFGGRDFVCQVVSGNCAGDGKTVRRPIVERHVVEPSWGERRLAQGFQIHDVETIKAMGYEQAPPETRRS